MKAIMINSKLKTVYYCDLSNNQDKRIAEIYDRLNCRMFAIGHTFPSGDALFVDDEGMVTLDDESTFFKVNGSQVLAGNGLILGNEIEFDDGSYTIEDVFVPLDGLDIRFFDNNTVSLPNLGYEIYGF